MTDTFNSFVPLIGLDESSSERAVSNLKQLSLKPSNTFVLFGDSITEMHKNFTTLDEVY